MATAGGSHILAIDLGTSGPKVGLATRTGQIVGHEFEPVKLRLLPGGGAEQDPDEWWQAIRRAAHRLLSRVAVSPADIAAVNCTGQWGGTVAVDHDGSPLTNAIIWLDTRGAPYIERLVSGRLMVNGYDALKAIQWVRFAGGPPTRAGKDPTAHILFLRNERPDVYRATHKFLEPVDYLNLKLTGLYAASYESITLHYVTDNRALDRVRYHDGLLRMTTLPREKLPDLRPTGSVLGPLTDRAAADLGLAAGTPVVIGTPDVHSAGIGSGAVRDGEAHLYLGTSAWVLCHVPFKKVDLTHYIGSMPSGIPGRYWCGSVQETGGACLTFLRDNLLYPGDALQTGPAPDNFYSLVDQLAEEAAPGSGKIIFTPWLYGERAPIEDSTVRGGFHNLSLGATRAQMVRAVLEGVAFNMRWGFTYLEPFVGRRLNPINAIGGGAKSATWCQILADVLDRTIRQVEDPDLCNIRGSALQAAAALGYLSFGDLGKQVPISASYGPNPANRQMYDDLFREYVSLYRQNRKIYARLNRQ